MQVSTFAGRPISQFPQPARPEVSFQSPPSANTLATPTEGYTPSSAEKLLAPNFDPKFRDKLLTDLNKLPAGALQKLANGGWRIQMFSTLMPNLEGHIPQAGRFVPQEKMLYLDRKTYSNDGNGGTMLHDLGYCLDVQQFQPSTNVLGRLLGKVGVNTGTVTYKSDQDPTMSRIYQDFQAKNDLKIGKQVLDQAKGAGKVLKPEEAVNFDFHNGTKGQTYIEKGVLVVAMETNPSHKKAKGVDGPVAPMEHSKLKTYQQDGYRITLTPEKHASQLGTSWCRGDDAVAVTNCPTHLFAEGISAYYSSPETRQQLQANSPDLYKHIETSMNEYIVADRTQSTSPSWPPKGDHLH